MKARAVKAVKRSPTSCHGKPASTRSGHTRVRKVGKAETPNAEISRPQTFTVTEILHELMDEDGDFHGYATTETAGTGASPKAPKD